MPPTLTRRSPVHHLLEPLGPTWGRAHDCPIALHFGDPDGERDTMRTLALCDLSALPKLGIKGAAAKAWLEARHMPVYGTVSLEGGGLVVKVAADELFLEGGIGGNVVEFEQQLTDNLSAPYRVERQDATFLLSGRHCREVLAQTCGINFAAAAPNVLIMTRVAVVSCSILPQPIEDLTIYRLWVDYSYAAYLWETLTQIIGELGGGIVGALCHYPDLAGDR